MIRQCMIAPTLARSSSHQYPPTLSTISDGTRWIRRPMTSIAKTDVEKEILDSVAADDAPRIIKPPPISLCQLKPIVHFGCLLVAFHHTFWREQKKRMASKESKIPWDPSVPSTRLKRPSKLKKKKPMPTG